ncbi:hypothetical protein [Burkholderia cenocepacia]|uniref:hypothetical protein n=1 Tax=Burkholderia cenocepacia TaxID=95486 RepID=UPI00076D2AA1|nr:hypothetical protein [Burkholderia cenocepacia]KWU19126.1 hypothetical protein AS149_12830 [Burkholderia cenocepacia]
MGRREWERGSITIPAAAWAGFKKALRDAYNTALMEDLALLEKAVAAVREAHKGKRNVDWTGVLQSELWRVEGRSSSLRHEEPRMLYPLKVVTVWDAKMALVVKDAETGKQRLQMPKKKDFTTAKADTLNYSAGGEAGFQLKNAERVVEWDVSENKSACDAARRTFMGKKLFELLGAIKWTRGTGGSIHGSDEYHEDAGRDSPGGGGSYLKDMFGPLGEAHHEHVYGWNRQTGRQASSSNTIRYVSRR